MGWQQVYMCGGLYHAVSGFIVNTIQMLTNRLRTAHFVWLKHIQLMFSGLFGVLIALGGNTLSGQPGHWFYALAIAALALGILCNAIALYAQIIGLSRLRTDYAEASIRKLKGSDGGPVSVRVPLLFSVCEHAAYIFYLFAILLLATYSCVRVFS